MRKVWKTAGLVVLGALVIVLILTAVGRLTGRENIFTRSFQSAAAPAEKLFSSATAIKLFKSVKSISACLRGDGRHAFQPRNPMILSAGSAAF